VTIEEFIHARLDEDERIAQAAIDDELPIPEDWPEIRAAQWEYSEFEGYDGKKEGQVRCVDLHLWDHCASNSQKRHIALHDPARILRQCAAIRESMKWCQLMIAEAANLSDSNHEAELALEALANIWSDHADYDNEWKL
jgi:hypothetical protein